MALLVVVAPQRLRGGAQCARGLLLTSDAHRPPSSPGSREGISLFDHHSQRVACRQSAPPPPSGTRRDIAEGIDTYRGAGGARHACLADACRPSSTTIAHATTCIHIHTSSHFIYQQMVTRHSVPRCRYEKAVAVTSSRINRMNGEEGRRQAACNTQCSSTILPHTRVACQIQASCRPERLVA